MVGDRSHRNRLHHLKGAAKGFSVGSMGSILTTTRITALSDQEEDGVEAEEKAKTAGLAVNHVMKYRNSGQFRALPPPYHPHQPFQPSAPSQAF
jgi:hypothetical protein